MTLRTKILILSTLPLLLLAVIGINRGSAQNAKQTKRVPLSVLQSSEPVIRSDYSKKTLLAPSKDGQSLYSLDAITGDLMIYEKNGKPTKKVSASFLNVEAFAVGPKLELYLAQKDSTVRIVSSDGRRLNSFHTVYPKSIAVLSNGNVVVASPFNGKNLHLYNGQGVLLASFGDIRPFDPSQTENEFLNEGQVVVGPDEQIYYVSTYAPEPYVLRFSSEGRLLGEFQIEGEAVDLQTGFTREFLNRRGFCNGGVTIITSATVNPETGHLWLGMNSLSTQGTVYEYDQTGTKVREFAFLLNSNNKIHNVTHVKDMVVSGDSLSILTTGGTYGFKLSDVLIADAWKVPTKTKTIKPTWGGWANPLAGIAKLWAPEPVIRPGIPQPVQSACGAAQDYSCIANCPAGTQPNPADCGAVIAGFFPTNSTKRVTEVTNCAKKPIDSTPGSTNPGGCTETVTWCDSANNNTTGSTSVTVNCTAVPTPTPTPSPSPENTGSSNGFCTNTCPQKMGWWQHAYPDCQCEYDGGGTVVGDSPILIDTLGNGFNLTDRASGVSFDLDNDGVRETTAWTALGSDESFLVLDRNSNGTIDNGGELFGNFTAQPAPPAGIFRNGFLALAEHDKPQNGGNGDGVIDQHDAIYSFLRLWQDTNHNGASEPLEIHTLSDLHVDSISLDFKESKRTDPYGNQFRYRAKVNETRWAWDVFFVAP
jgi:hypothetical protein